VTFHVTIELRAASEFWKGKHIRVMARPVESRHGKVSGRFCITLAARFYFFSKNKKYANQFRQNESVNLLQRSGGATLRVQGSRTKRCQ